MTGDPDPPTRGSGTIDIERDGPGTPWGGTRTSPRASAECLDSRSADAAVTRATLRDIALANTVFGGRAAVVFGVERLLEGVDGAGHVTVIDVGAGRGDITASLPPRFRRTTTLRPTAVDWHMEAARACRSAGLASAVADAQRLPFGDRAFDIAVASQLLHHFEDEAAAALVRELDRVARIGVVVADLERRRAAALGIWAASFALRFHPVSRHDGVTSVRRGFTARELGDLLATAGMRPAVFRRPGFRLVGVWRARRANTR